MHAPSGWRRDLSTGLLWLLLYAAIAAVTLGANPFKNETITPFDVLVSQRAWSFVDPTVEVKSYQRSDILNSLLPQWESAKQQIANGRFPLWNDKVAGGGPFLTVSTGMFTPAFLVFAATPDSALGFHLGVLLNLALAGLGMHLFLRRHLGLLATITGATTFQLCGFMAAWLYWPHVFTLIWAPWLLWAIDRCAYRPDIRRAVPISVATALVALGGFPFLSVLTLEVAALYAAVLCCFRSLHPQGRVQFAGWYAAGTLLGLLLAALPLLGLLHWLQQFDLGYREGRGSYLDIGHWKQLFPPWAYRTQRVEQTMYIGAVMLFLAAASTINVAVRWKRIGALPLFGILLLIITAGLVFDLWPMWLIQWLPGMSFNAWSRAIGLLSIALVILGAIFLDHLWKLGTQRGLGAIRPLLGVLALLQLVEVSLFFRDFNGPVSADYYFPETPTIEYVREHAGPFDHVVTDRSFVMSGTLGVYGLREWMAHYFRSPALQAALHEMAERPFHSHRASASRFPAANIKYGSPAMADYNVRYVLVDSRSGPDLMPPVQPHEGGKHVPLPPMPAHSYVQEFSLGGANLLAGVSVRLATYMRTDLPGQVALSVRDPSGVLRGRALLDAESIIDNGFAEFWFDHPIALGDGLHTFSLEYRPEGTNPFPITAWSFASSSETANLRVNGERSEGTIQYQLYATKTGGEPFRHVFTSSGTAVFENRGSPRGPYFLRSLPAHANRHSGADVVVGGYQPDSFTLTYSGTAPGYVIVPMSMHPDWRVTVNGVVAEVQAKDGVMPAVAVTGPATIDFRYRPRVLMWVYPWLAVLAFVLLAMFYTDRRIRTRSRK